MKQLKIFAVLLLSIAAMLLLGGCDNEEPESSNFVGKLTVNYFNEAGELLTSYTDEYFSGSFEDSSEIKKHIPSVDKVGYTFLGWHVRVNNEGDIIGTGNITSLSAITSYEYSDSNTLFSSVINRTREDNGERQIFLYPLYRKDEYGLYFCNLNANESASSLIYREEGQTSYMVICDIDYVPRAPGGYSESSKQIVGWQLHDRYGEVPVFDFAGNLLISKEELYNIAAKEVQFYNTPEWSSNALCLYPIFGETFSILTFDFLAEELSCEYAKVLWGDTFESVTQPEAYYSSLGLFVGWSLDKDSLVPVEGVADGSDITVYAIWTPAKRLNVWLQGKDEPIQLYIKEDGELIGELPFEYRKYDISEWFRDGEREEGISLSYANVRADEDLYVSLLQTRKEVTLNPCNGEPEYTVLIGKDANITLPEWQGYEIEGWYLDRACDGERFELDFDSVSDGATYYAKWVKS